MVSVSGLGVMLTKSSMSKSLKILYSYMHTKNDIHVTSQNQKYSFEEKQYALILIF